MHWLFQTAITQPVLQILWIISNFLSVQPDVEETKNEKPWWQWISFTSCPKYFIWLKIRNESNVLGFFVFCLIPPCEPTKMRSKADGVPPLCTWPKMVTRVSKPKFLTTSFWWQHTKGFSSRYCCGKPSKTTLYMQKHSKITGHVTH